MRRLCCLSVQYDRMYSMRNKHAPHQDKDHLGRELWPHSTSIPVRVKMGFEVPTSGLLPHRLWFLNVQVRELTKKRLHVDTLHVQEEAVHSIRMMEGSAEHKISPSATKGNLQWSFSSFLVQMIAAQADRDDLNIAMDSPLCWWQCSLFAINSLLGWSVFIL